MEIVSKGRTRCGRRAEGFSLLELLVAITITALLSTAVIAAFRVGVTSWQRGGDFLDRSQRLSAAAALIQKQIGSAAPLFTLDSLKTSDTGKSFYNPPSDGPEFVGEAREMVFVTDYPVSASSEGGLQFVHYIVGWPDASGGAVSAAPPQSTPSGAGMVLQMTSAPIYRREDFLNLVNLTRVSLPSTVTLLEGIRDIEFHYWAEEQAASATGGGGSNVHVVSFDRWDSLQQKRLPEAVSLRIRFAPGGQGVGGRMPYNRDGLDLFIPINVMKSL